MSARSTMALLQFVVQMVMPRLRNANSARLGWTIHIPFCLAAMVHLVKISNDSKSSKDQAVLLHLLRFLLTNGVFNTISADLLFEGEMCENSLKPVEAMCCPSTTDNFVCDYCSRGLEFPDNLLDDSIECSELALL